MTIKAKYGASVPVRDEEIGELNDVLPVVLFSRSNVGETDTFFQCRNVAMNDQSGTQWDGLRHYGE